MNSTTCEKWTVLQLREYLRQRRVPHSGYKKGKLLQLVKNSVENPSLLDIVEPLEQENVSDERRTVEVNGRRVVLPDPNSLTHWDKDLTNMPRITSAYCLLYLMNKRGWSGKRLENFEKQRGVQLCLDNHINEVFFKKMSDDLAYIKAKCIRQTSQNEAPYCVWLLATMKGTIESSGCQCTG